MAYVKIYNLIVNSNYLVRREVEDFIQGYKYKDFPPFPDYHLRTNAFMISRRLMLKIKHKKMKKKFDAYRFESGKNSLTNQVLRRGLNVLIIGKDRKGYEKEEWHRSGTWWQGEQDNLLIGDNQSSEYTHGDSKRRMYLSRLAWGEKANIGKSSQISASHEQRQTRQKHPPQQQVRQL